MRGCRCLVSEPPWAEPGRLPCRLKGALDPRHGSSDIERHQVGCYAEMQDLGCPAVLPAGGHDEASSIAITECERITWTLRTRPLHNAESALKDYQAQVSRTALISAIPVRSPPTARKLTGRADQQLLAREMRRVLQTTAAMPAPAVMLSAAQLRPAFAP